MAEGEAEQILSYMIENGILSDDQGTLWLGQEGEQTFGWRNFMELFSVFNSPPMFKVNMARRNLGKFMNTPSLSETRKRLVAVGGKELGSNSY